MISEGQFPRALPAHRHRPVRQSPISHGAGRPAVHGFDDRYFRLDSIRVAPEITHLDEIRNERMQAVHGYEFLGEIKRRAEMINAAVDVLRIAEIPNVFLGGIESAPQRLAGVGVAAKS